MSILANIFSNNCGLSVEMSAPQGAAELRAEGRPLIARALAHSGTRAVVHREWRVLRERTSSLCVQASASHLLLKHF